jgi:hypothetical protein
MIAALPGRRRCDHYRHGRRSLEFTRERAAELTAAEARRARAQDDQVRPFLGRYLREPFGTVAEYNPLLRPVPNLTRNRVEKVSAAGSALPGRQASLGTRRYSVYNVNKHEP